jgi:hypothetical protein
MKLAIDKIPLNEFRRSVENFFEMIEDITDSLYGTRKAISWFVKVEAGSNNLLAIAEQPDNPEIRPKEVSTTLKNGLKIIRGGARPDNFSDRTLERLQSLADLSEDHGLDISINKQQISSKIHRNVNNILRLAYSEIGTIEGHLRILAKRAEHLEVEILDEISERLIHCIISPAQLEDAKEAFDRRVSLSGLIHYRADGTPIRIEVEEGGFFRFPFNRELPHHKDVRGMLGDAN